MGQNTLKISEDISEKLYKELWKSVEWGKKEKRIVFFSLSAELESKMIKEQTLLLATFPCIPLRNREVVPVLNPSGAAMGRMSCATANHNHGQNPNT